MSMKSIACFVVGVLLFAAGEHLAVAAAGAAGPAFQAMTPSDASYIQHTGYAVYNSDASASHDITAPAGSPGFCIDCGVTTYSFHAAVYDNGGTITCTAYVIELTGSFPTHVGTSRSVTTVGGATLAFDVTLTESAGGIYAPSIACTLPASSGANGNATLFGVYLP